MTYERIGERVGFFTTCGSFDSYCGRRGGHDGRGFVVAMILEAMVGLVVVNLANVLNVVIVIILWIFVDLHSKPSRFANQAFSLEDSLTLSGPPASSSPAPDYDLISISKDEYAQFLAHKWATSTSTTTLAQLGTAFHYLLSSTPDHWVIDFGVNEHMTGSSTSLFDYYPVDTSHSVTVANGFLSTVADSGHTHLSLDIELLSVLHVPSFPLNLLSISKITKTLNCSISFYPSLCIFRISRRGRRLVWGMKLIGGLYYLDLAPSFPSRALQSSTSTL